MNFILRTAASLLAASALTAGAADVEIDARGGVIPNDPSADVVIRTAEGEGSSISLAEAATSVKSLVESQSVVSATVEIGLDQRLSAESVRIAPGAANLTLGSTAAYGDLMPLGNTLSVEVADAASLLTVNANIVLGSQALAKSGLGSFLSNGDFCGAVRQTGGTSSFGGYGGSGELSISGDSANFEFASSSILAQSIKSTYSAAAALRTNETVVTASGSTVPVDVLQVNGGAKVRFLNSSLASLDMSGYAADNRAVVPDCIYVGSNSTGVLTFDNSSYVGKLVLAAGEKANAHAALRLVGGSTVKSYCSTNGECVFARGGAASVETSGASKFTLCGRSVGGVNGQFGLVITNSTFALSSSDGFSSGFVLGGSASRTSMYVGNGGTFDATASADDFYMPLLNATNALSAQLTATEGAAVNLGTRRFMLGGNANSGSDSVSVFNLNGSCVVTAGGIRRPVTGVNKGSVYVQFNGGVFKVNNSSSSFTPFDFPLYSFEGGVEIEVAKNREVVLNGTCPVLAPGGRGIDAVPLTVALANETFAGPPQVAISGGGGHGATAICEFDCETHRVTGIRVTGRGSDYGVTTTTATAFYGDKSWSLPISAENLSDNVSGGLTKSGDGVLVLAATNTYTGVTRVDGGMLKLTVPDAINAASTLKLFGSAVIDLGGFDATFGNFGGDGSGEVRNGEATIAALTCDFRVVLGGYHDVLNMQNVKFAADAKFYLTNAADSTVDRAKEYVLYEFKNGTPEQFPMIDDSSYENLSSAWGVVLKDDKAVLKYVDGSLFIYY